MDYIDINQKIMLSKPTIKGSRIPVESLLEELGAGKTVEDLIAAYQS